MIGQNIRTIRESRGLTQAQLADRVGVSSGTVSSWEVDRTEPNIGMIEKISVALNCQKTDLIGHENDFALSDHERRLVIAYRQTPSMQDAVDRLLGIEKKEQYCDSRKEA